MYSDLVGRMTVKWVKLRRRTSCSECAHVGENKLRGFFCCFVASCRRRPPSAMREKIVEGKGSPWEEKQEKTRCANERLRVTEDVDVYKYSSRELQFRYSLI